MPWTFAHPAVILPLHPLCPRWLSWPGLVLGAMAPDLGYYVGLHGLAATFCHTPRGVVTVCLPLSLLVLALLLRFSAPLTILLPEPHRAMAREQLQPSRRAAWASLAAAVLSILIGAASHVFWDSFTHSGRWGIEWLHALNRPAFAAVERQVHVAGLLQHLSSVVGVAALVAVYRRALRARRRVEPPPRDALRIRVLQAGLAGALFVGVLSAWAFTPATEPAYASHLLVHAVVVSTSCFTTLFLVGSWAWWRLLGGD
ncbi:DUF4184 family protein [Roseateles sp.]|uniref:DUF4184 family protein n=1 Tax=Roseateles sp. TaxID=1971397 RepID=UPI0025CF8E2C|nr:DUF4184 family protein [Roseateles sp.]MBV8036096.1 DUF4184 family protein [Roseateles sp.]